LLIFLTNILESEAHARREGLRQRLTVLLAMSAH
jgi:hypothetical protein